MIDLLAATGHWERLLRGERSARSALRAAMGVDAPQPGEGATVARWQLLAGATAVDAAVGRLVEGHLDAVAILREAGREPASQSYGVWASRAGGQRVVATADEGGWRLSGQLPFSSGAGTVQRALVVADTDAAEATSAERRLLVEVATDRPGFSVIPGTWPSPAMSASDSLTVELDGVRVEAQDVIGRPGFYTERQGFWYGSMGVAACWAGAAAAVAANAIEGTADGRDPHQAAHVGALHASVFAMRAALDSTAAQLDGRDLTDQDDAEMAALTVRHLVAREAEAIVHHAGRAGGASLLAHDVAHACRVSDLLLYIRQSHGERDLAELGSLAKAERGRLPRR